MATKRMKMRLSDSVKERFWGKGSGYQDLFWNSLMGRQSISNYIRTVREIVWFALMINNMHLVELQSFCEADGPSNPDVARVCSIKSCAFCRIRIASFLKLRSQPIWRYINAAPKTIRRTPTIFDLVRLLFAISAKTQEVTLQNARQSNI